jgi:Cupin domain
MAKKLNAGDLIDMMGARFEMVARMGSEQRDTVLFRTRMAPGKLVPLHSHIDPECFYVLAGRLEVFLVDEASKWRWVETGQSLLIENGIKQCGPQSDRAGYGPNSGDEQPVCLISRRGGPQGRSEHRFLAAVT